MQTTLKPLYERLIALRKYRSGYRLVVSQQGQGSLFLKKRPHCRLDQAEKVGSWTTLELGVEFLKKELEKYVR